MSNTTCTVCTAGNPARRNYGKLVGKLQEYAHGIKGTVYVVDETTLFVQGFSYDGTAPGESSLSHNNFLVTTLSSRPQRFYSLIQI